MADSVIDQSFRVVRLIGERPGIRVSDIVLLTGMSVIDLLKVLAELEDGGTVSIVIEDMTQNFFDYRIYMTPH